MDSCSAAYEGSLEPVHKQVRDAGRPTVLGGLLDGNRGTLSASPSRALVVALQSLRVAALPGASRLLLEPVHDENVIEPLSRTAAQELQLAAILAP